MMKQMEITIQKIENGERKIVPFVVSTKGNGVIQVVLLHYCLLF
jgi:hypothetical protein